MVYLSELAALDRSWAWHFREQDSLLLSGYKYLHFELLPIDDITA